MSVRIERRRWTTEEYHRMLDVALKVEDIL